MGFENITRLVARLEDMKAVDKDTIKYVNHFSHNGNPDHAHLEEIAEKIDFKVSYDGLNVEL